MNEVLRLASSELEVEIWTLGARLNGLWFQGIGSLVDGAADEDEARGPKKFNGATVGPVANRIAEGRASIDGHDCEFERNENDLTTLHSGATGVHAALWEVTLRDDREAVLQLDLADGAGGFPGNRRLTAGFAVSNMGLSVQYEAVSDAPTWINLALHPYWSLGVGRAGLALQVDADHYTPVDAAKIPTGEIAPVTDRFDLRALAAPSPEIDHNFVLQPDGKIALTSDPLRLDVETDAPGVQIYSGKEIGIAIEPQHFPDAMHHARFPSIELRPGETYRQKSSYRFSRV